MCTTAPPVFRQKITALEINVGGHARFECEIEEAPDVTFKWYKSGTEIRQTEKYRILSRHGGSSLELLNPIKADSGEYTCRASNQHGTDSCTASLIVTGKTKRDLLPVSVSERERIIYVQPNCGSL